MQNSKKTTKSTTNVQKAVKSSTKTPKTVQTTSRARQAIRSMKKNNIVKPDFATSIDTLESEHEAFCLADKHFKLNRKTWDEINTIHGIYTPEEKRASMIFDMLSKIDRQLDPSFENLYLNRLHLHHFMATFDAPTFKMVRKIPQASNLQVVNN